LNRFKKKSKTPFVVHFHYRSAEGDGGAAISMRFRLSDFRDNTTLCRIHSGHCVMSISGLRFNVRSPVATWPPARLSPTRRPLSALCRCEFIENLVNDMNPVCATDTFAPNCAETRRFFDRNTETGQFCTVRLTGNRTNFAEKFSSPAFNFVRCNRVPGFPNVCVENPVEKSKADAAHSFVTNA